VDGFPQIAELRKEADQTTHIGGGDTHFADVALSDSALSPGLRKTLDALQAVHSIAHVFGARGGYAKAADLCGRIGNTQAVTQDVAHPGVIRHLDTSRRTLYVNAAFTTRFEGWTAAESAPMLNLL
jgi:taurine dioxygenase